jgi:hypothetical protein
MAHTDEKETTQKPLTDAQKALQEEFLKTVEAKIRKVEKDSWLTEHPVHPLPKLKTPSEEH